VKTIHEELIDTGGANVVAVQSTRGKPIGSVHEVSHRQATVFTLRGEKVLRAREYPTRVEALEAAGQGE
jgi:ketosteroid isomerase-like protein